MIKYCNGGGGCMESGRDGDVDLHECGYGDVSLYADVGGSVGVDCAASVGSDGGDGGGCGDSSSTGSIGGYRFCGSGIWVE